MIEAANAKGVLMLDIMTGAARNAWARAQTESDPEKAKALENEASDLAARAAPYLHHRLAAIQHSGEGGGPVKHEHQLSDADRKRLDKLDLRALARLYHETARAAGSAEG